MTTDGTRTEPAADTVEQVRVDLKASRLAAWPEQDRGLGDSNSDMGPLCCTDWHQTGDGAGEHDEGDRLRQIRRT